MPITLKKMLFLSSSNAINIYCKKYPGHEKRLKRLQLTKKALIIENLFNKMHSLIELVHYLYYQIKYG